MPLHEIGDERPFAECKECGKPVLRACVIKVLPEEVSPKRRDFVRRRLVTFPKVGGAKVVAHWMDGFGEVTSHFHYLCRACALSKFSDPVTLLGEIEMEDMGMEWLD